jgi:hypothetical protein
VTTTRPRRLVLGCAGIAAVAAVAVWLANTIPGPPRPEHGGARAVPASDQVRARAMLPAIDAYLDRDAGRLGFGGALSARLRPRVFCDASIIEVRPAEALSSAGFRPFVVSWQVGIVMNCGEFARRGHALLEGSAGYPGIGEIVTVTGSPGDYRAGSLDVGPPYHDTSWVRAHFSPGAAALVLSEKVTAPDPVRQARRAFGFPPATRAAGG